MVERIDIAPGSLVLGLDATALAVLLATNASRLAVGTITTSVPFQLRKLGAETRLVLAEAPARRDDTLIRKTARTHHWFWQIRIGRSFDAIAWAEGVSKRRIRQMIDLAIQATDTIRDVLDGK